MPNNETPQHDPTHLAEARASKHCVRRALRAMIDEHLATDPLLLDTALEESLFEDLPWRDPSPSGEFEAIHA
jgi:hypothetical protein